MADRTGIEWTDATWNPVTGCTEVSPGCDHCYAKTFAERWRGTEGHYFERGFDVQLRPDKLNLPLRWTKPRKVFVNSMSDLFHAGVPDDHVAEVFAVMALAKRHTFQLLTKRHGRMRSLLSSPDFARQVRYMTSDSRAGEHLGWPLPNVWLGVSVEDQKRADLRIPALLDTPAAVRWLSCEPLLGPVLLKDWVQPPCGCCFDLPGRACVNEPGQLSVDWVVVGGESGHGARPMHPAWARSLRDQCVSARVPFLFKQWGEHAPRCRLALVGHRCSCDGANPSHGDPEMVRVGKKPAGRVLDGRTYDEYPESWAGRSREDSTAAGAPNQVGDR